MRNKQNAGTGRGQQPAAKKGVAKKSLTKRAPTKRAPTKRAKPVVVQAVGQAPGAKRLRAAGGATLTDTAPPRDAERPGRGGRGGSHLVKTSELARPAGVGKSLKSPSKKRSPLRDAFLKRGKQLVERLAEMVPEDVLVDALGKASPLDTVATAMTAVVGKDRTLDARDRVLAAARARGVSRMQQILAQAGGAYSAEQLAAVLGKAGGRQTISAGRESNLYFGLPTPTGYAYPKLQVAEGGQMLSGLRTFLEAFTLPDPWMKLVVLLEPSPRLEGRTPLEALRQGDVDGAVAVASAYGSHGA